MKKLLMGMIFLVGLTSCSRPPQIQYYDLELVLSRGERSTALPLVVQPFEAGPMLDQEKFLYRNSPYELRTDPYRRWTMPPPALLTEQARRFFKESNQMEVLSRLPADRRAYELRATVYNFEEIAIPDRQRTGRVTIWFELYDAAAKKVVLSEIIEKTAPISGGGAEAIVEALRAAAQAVFEELAAQIKAKAASDQSAE